MLTRGLMSLVFGVAMATLPMSPASADTIIKVDRNCSRILITVAPPVAGSYELLGRPDSGANAGQVNTWAAVHDNREAIIWTDWSYGTVTYWFVKGHVTDPDRIPGDQLIAGPVTSHTNC